MKYSSHFPCLATMAGASLVIASTAHAQQESTEQKVGVLGAIVVSASRSQAQVEAMPRALTYGLKSRF